VSPAGLAQRQFPELKERENFGNSLLDCCNCRNATVDVKLDRYCEEWNRAVVMLGAALFWLEIATWVMG
jgi:hypothetical protein